MTSILAQAAAGERAEKAESKLAEIRVGFRKEQLTVQAKLQKLESELRAAKGDAKVAERRRTSSELLTPSKHTR